MDCGYLADRRETVRGSALLTKSVWVSPNIRSRRCFYNFTEIVSSITPTIGTYCHIISSNLAVDLRYHIVCARNTMMVVALTFFGRIWCDRLVRGKQARHQLWSAHVPDVETLR